MYNDSCLITRPGFLIIPSKVSIIYKFKLLIRDMLHDCFACFKWQLVQSIYLRLWLEGRSDFRVANDLINLFVYKSTKIQQRFSAHALLLTLNAPDYLLYSHVHVHVHALTDVPDSYTERNLEQMQQIPTFPHRPSDEAGP